MTVLILFAFLGGVVTILSPCILPILPIILSGSVGGGKNKPFGVVVGFVLSFTFFTLFLTTIVNVTGISPNALRNLSVVILVFFGLSLLIPKIQATVEHLFSKIASRVPNQNKREGFGGGIVIGLSLGLLWTPCVGPILASVISLALTGSVSTTAFIITFFYALGTAIPMLIIMYGGRATLNRVPWLTRNLGNIQKGFGVVMIITAGLIFFNIDRSIQAYLLGKFPNYGVGLTSLEDNESVKENLGRLENIEKTDNANSDKYPIAPELIPGGDWINSEPLNLSELQGRIVMIDFMTYSCINCIRTFPYLNDWYNKYKDDGFVIIGVHTPEFEFEKDINNVKKALEDFGIEFPVMQDNDYKTWQAYGNKYWPRKYLINHEGRIVYDHIGEGKYEETEKLIQKLINEKNKNLGNSATPEKKLSDINNERNGAVKSPETYFGASRNSLLGNGQKNKVGIQSFQEPESIEPNILYLVGDWDIQKEFAKNLSENARVIFQYEASNVYMVAGADETRDVKIINGGKIIEKDLQVDDMKLYDLIKDNSDNGGLLELNIDEAGLEIFTFTFG